MMIGIEMSGEGAFANSEARELVERFDWSATPLGPIDLWLPCLTAVVELVLGSPVAMVVLWGAELTQIYNDAYAVIAGPRHPHGIGQATRACWPEVWEFNGPIYAAVLRGEARVFTAQHLVIKRNGASEDAWFDLAYSPVRDDRGRVGGVLVTVVETTRQMLAEQRVVGHDERQRRLFEQSSGFICISSGPEHVFEYGNETYAALIGRSDFVGRTVRAALPELDGQGFFERLDEVYATGERFVAEHYPVKLRRTADAALQTRFVNFVYAPVADESGVITGIFTQGHDVTDAHVALDRQRADAAFLQSVLASSNDCIKVLDLDGNLVFMNEGGQRLMEVSDFNALAGCPWLSFWDGVGNADARAAADEARAGRAARFQGAASTMGGTLKWWDVHVTPIFGSDGEPVQLLCVSRDIGELKQAEVALRDLNADLEQRIVDRSRELSRTWHVSPDPMGVLNPQGYFVESNPAWATVLGWSESEVRNAWCLDYIHPDDLANSRAAFERMKQGEILLQFENRCRTSDGRWRWLSWIMVPEGGNFYCTARDVTEDKERAAELEVVEAQLRQAQKMEAVGQLTGGIAHDFNNMLAGVIGGLEVIQRRLAAGRTDDLDRFIDGARQSGDRAASLIKRLLAFSRRQNLKIETIDVVVLARGMEELLQRTLGISIGLVVAADPDAWFVGADAIQLESALLNLAINARDAMPDGGDLTIAIGNVSHDPADSGWPIELAPGDYVAITVSDTGTGMPQTVIDKAFDPFFTTKAIGQGTGLGLSMIYGFAKQSRGHVVITSAVGRGTTITLYLPRAAAVDAAHVHSDSVTPARGSLDLTILVVDDEPAVRMVMVETLAQLGYTTVEAADGNAAVAILRSEQRVGLLLTDIGLPGMNGRQLSAIARDLRPDLQVLFVTGYAGATLLRDDELGAGFGIITKPFAIADLGTKIGDMLAVDTARGTGTTARRTDQVAAAASLA